jgi:hypothetical protein
MVHEKRIMNWEKYSASSQQRKDMGDGGNSSLTTSKEKHPRGMHSTIQSCIDITPCLVPDAGLKHYKITSTAWREQILRARMRTTT